MWTQIPEPDGVIWKFCAPRKPWGFVRGTYTRPNHDRGYTLNEPGLVAKGEMTLAIEHEPGTTLWEHYEKQPDGFWWSRNGHDMGALLCDPEFVACIKAMDLTMEHGPQWTAPHARALPPARDSLREMERIPEPTEPPHWYRDKSRRGGKQRKGRNWWNH